MQARRKKRDRKTGDGPGTRQRRKPAYVPMIDIVLHLDVHLLQWVAAYGVWIYAILFAIIFAETGFVVTPFLPGDSLLFVAGAIAATGELSVLLLVVLLVAAAFLGNLVNYAVGRWLG